VKDIGCFTWKTATKHVPRFAFVVLALLFIGLFVLPNLPRAGASEADASSLELAGTQTVSYTAASTRSPADPFTMIILNDPQFPFPTIYDSNKKPEFSHEQWHKVNAIDRIYNKKTKGDNVRFWPNQRLKNDKFDRWNTPVPQVAGVIINGDLTYMEFDDDDWYMTGLQATNWPNWKYERRNWLYRDYYVTWLKEMCPDLPVYAGFGNHDSKWTTYDLACALTLGEEYEKGGSEWNFLDANKRREWTNFPEKSSFYDIDFDEQTKTGSLAYSWDQGNYHFVQANNIKLPHDGPIDLKSKWLNGMELESPLKNGWLKKDLVDATNREMKIVLNMHWWQTGWLDIEKIIHGTNTVAVFVGHQCYSRSGFSGTGMYDFDSGWFPANNAVNAFNQRIPVFQAGHSGYNPTMWVNDNQLLIVECADDYMNVGLVSVGDWDVEEGHNCGVPCWSPSGQDWPSNENYMRTIKFVNTPPSVDVQSEVPVEEGQSTFVARGNFEDDPCYYDSWNGKVDFGDGNVTEFTQFPDWGGSFSLDSEFEHTYEENGKYTISASIEDKLGESDTTTCEVTVLNAPPIVDVSNKTVFKGESFTLTASFSDPGVLDKHTATVEWGDGTPPNSGTVYEQDGSGTVTASHTYTAAGSYTLTVTVTDDDGGSNFKTADIEVTAGSSIPVVLWTIESCDIAGSQKDTFAVGDDVYAIGTGYNPSTTFDLFLVEDVTWIDGMAIPPRVPGTTTTITSDGAGNVPPTLLWSNPVVPGKYDLVVDLDGDGLYYANTDALDDIDIEITAGLFVIPEVAFGSIMAIASMFTALGFYAYKKKQKPTK